jgi:ferredoxin
MKTDSRTVLTCTCRGTIAVGAVALAEACGAASPAAHELCRAEMGRFRAALGQGPVLVTCSQEAPAFRLEQEAGGDLSPLAFVNVRETAGWSDEGARALPKIAALVAEAQLLAAEPEALPITLQSSGVTLIYGRDDLALEAAEQLKDRLDITVMLTGSAATTPLRVASYPVVRGTIKAARGHLGAFELQVDGFGRAIASSRRVLEFEAPRNEASSRCDLIIDLTGGTPLFPAHAKRDGYLRPDPGDPVAVQKALFAASDLTGTFDKPRYVTLDPALCAHARSGKIGCTRCLDNCSTGAITPAGDSAAIDPHICAGCGTCAAVCPTEAVRWAIPDAEASAEATASRLRSVLAAYRRAGGQEPPVILLHDRTHGEPLIDMLARAGDGLPARVIPICEPRVLGLDSLAAAFAFGAAEVRVLVGRGGAADREAMERESALLDAILRPLGYGDGRIEVIETEDPFVLGDTLRALPHRPAPPPGAFLPIGGKREITMQALNALQAAAPAPRDAIALPSGAPLGRINVAEGCTLCLACVSACPTSALRDDPERPVLRFVEDNCVQCGLCRSTCPERVISLEPRVTFGAGRREPVVLREQEPALCISCGKLFGVKASIDRVAAQLVGRHWMFAEPSVIERIRMCGDCRMRSQLRERLDPYAAGPRPPTRTIDDYRGS